MHILIVGNTMSGKSNLAKSFASQKQNVIVFDPLKSNGWPNSIAKFSDPDLFFKTIKQSSDAHIFCDEAKILWDADKKEADRLLYNRRHQGLLVYLIAQRTRMIPPNGRNQCSRVFAFRQQKDDADILAQEYTPEFTQCLNLRMGDFIGSDGFSTQSYHLDYSTGLPPKIVKNLQKS